MSKQLFHYYFEVPEARDDENYEQVSRDVLKNKIQHINSLKTRIDNYYDASRKYNIWNCMSRDLHPYEGIVDFFQDSIRCVSRAFYKLTEILISFDIIIPPRSSSGLTCNNTLHLCEAPGGFIQSCLLYYGDAIDRFYTISIDSTIKYHKDIRKSQRGTIFIRDLTIENEFDETIEHLPQEGFPLITADGAFDVSNNYENQEHSTFDLLFNEISMALSCQAPGGSFIIKVFDCLLPKTWNLIVWLKSCYEHVYICKPPSSRPVNSERYCVCKGFREHKYYRPFIERESQDWLPRFRSKLISDMLDYQISNLEKVFAHIRIAEETSNNSNEANLARKERINLASQGEKQYNSIYGNILTTFST